MDSTYSFSVGRINYRKKDKDAFSEEAKKDEALIDELGGAGEKAICSKSFTGTIRRRGFSRSFAEATDFSDILLVRHEVAISTVTLEFTGSPYVLPQVPYRDVRRWQRRGAASSFDKSIKGGGNLHPYTAYKSSLNHQRSNVANLWFTRPNFGSKYKISMFLPILLASDNGPYVTSKR